MTKVPPANFSPEMVALMNSALDTAVHRIDRSHRTPATKAKMAQRIVRTASEGVTDLHVFDECCDGRGACASGVTTDRCKTSLTDDNLGCLLEYHAAAVTSAAAAAFKVGL